MSNIAVVLPNYGRIDVEFVWALIVVSLSGDRCILQSKRRDTAVARNATQWAPRSRAVGMGSAISTGTKDEARCNPPRASNMALRVRNIVQQTRRLAGAWLWRPAFATHATPAARASRTNGSEPEALNTKPHDTNAESLRDSGCTACTKGTATPRPQERLPPP